MTIDKNRLTDKCGALNEAKMAEGYQALAGENKRYAVMAAEIEHEVITEWE